MANRKAPVTRTELERYVNVMRAVQIDDWRLEIEQPDGTIIRFVAGKPSEVADDPDDIDAMIARVPREIS